MMPNNIVLKEKNFNFLSHDNHCLLKLDEMFAKPCL